MSGEEAAVGLAGKPLIDQKGHAPVLMGADYPARSLQHLAHTGIDVGVVEARTPGFIKILFDEIPAGPDLGQAHAHHRHADESFPHKVDSLAEDAALAAEAGEADDAEEPGDPEPADELEAIDDSEPVDDAEEEESATERS